MKARQCVRLSRAQPRVLKGRGRHVELFGRAVGKSSSGRAVWKSSSV